MTPNPIICAIDTTDMAKATALAGALKPHVGAIKLGLEFFMAHGTQGVAQVAALGAPIFLDLKFHDIPNTVAGALRGVAGLECFLLTVHAAGGYDMMKAAAQQARENAAHSGKSRPKIVGVTVLTSMDAQDLSDIGVANALEAQVLRLAALAQKAGLDGVVCSPHEIHAIRKACGKDFTLVVPGIRPEGSAQGDQKRTMTPKEAMAAGADYLVIGRPITGAADPAAAAADIFASLC